MAPLPAQDTIDRPGQARLAPMPTREAATQLMEDKVALPTVYIPGLRVEPWLEDGETRRNRDNQLKCG